MNPSPQPSSSPSPAVSDLLDQSALSALAQRLVEAALRAGADAADAVAVRGVSHGVEVRDGKVEESERSEGDDVGLRVLVGKRQAVVSTSDISATMSHGSPSARWRWPGSRRMMPMWLATRRGAQRFPDLDCSIRTAVRCGLERRAREARSRARGRGRVEVRRRVGVGRHRAWCGHHAGFHGAYLPRATASRPRDRRRRHRRSATTISPRAAPADLAAPRKSRTGARRWRGSTRAGRDLQGAVVFDPRVRARWSAIWPRRQRRGGAAASFLKDA